MTNESMRNILKRISAEDGHSVRKVDNLEAVLVEGFKTYVMRQYTNYYDYLLLLQDGEKAGIILKCDSVDIFIYVYRKFRNQRVVSRLIGESFLKNLWPDIESITCSNVSNYKKIKHLAEIAGYKLRGRDMLWVS